MSWRDAIEKVLRETDRPLHYAEISEQVLSRATTRLMAPLPMLQSIRRSQVQ